MNSEGKEILMEIAQVLHEVSKENGLYINYVKICWAAMQLLHRIWETEYCIPVNVEEIYKEIGIEIKKVDLNEFMDGGDMEKVNKIIGKISIRPDYIAQNSKKITVYVDVKASPTAINYALAHELGHLFLNYEQMRYTDDYCIMPMLPKKADELVVDAFAIFLLLPFDKFLEIFITYVEKAKEQGTIPIDTNAWLNYLSSVTAVPNYYVACGYQQIRHVAFLMYKIHVEDNQEDDRKEYAKEIYELYECVKDKMKEEVLDFLYQ